MAHRSGPPFAYTAEEDGIIEKIDIESKVIRVKYKSGKTVAVNYGDEYTSNGGGGFYCTQNVIINNFEEGAKVKTGDVIVYNDKFFTPDPLSKQINWNIGSIVPVALIETSATVDDSSILSRKLADKLMFNPVHIRDIVLNKTTTVHKYAPVGKLVSNIDPLMIFDQSELSDDVFGSLNEEAVDLLAKLNKQTPKARYSGKIVKIDAFYTCPITEMSPGIRGIVNLINKEKLAKHTTAKGTVNLSAFPPVVNINKTNRIGTTDLDNETVILRYYIQQDMEVNGGDKVEFASSLKSVCCGIEEDGWLTESKEPVEAIFSYIGINNRIVLSPIIMGLCNRVLEHAEKNILNMYFDE